MFDKLIESDTAGAEFKDRRRYFMVSTVVVGILFLTAVVWSLYAAEIGIVDGNFDIAELMAPVEMAEPEPEREPQSPRTSPLTQENSDQTIRRVIMASTDVPTIAPTSISTVKNSYRSTTRFEGIRLGPRDVDGGLIGPARDSEITGTTSDTRKNEDEDEVVSREAPPPALKKSLPIIRTSKVLNGAAISLPKPIFPQPAIILNLQGSVRIQVTIDEKGNVISAKAADGHPLFRQVAEMAARNAKFKPTLLNDAPVKVTGVIVYNFKRN